MNEAALHFIGEHDFACLQKAHSDVKTTICNVTEAFWEPLNMTKEPFSSDFVFTVSANRFLRNMVRAMVGTLLEVGTGKKDPNWIPLLLKSKNRCMAGNSVPGNALFLTNIKY
jgi:Pseudouridylate synthase